MIRYVAVFVVAALAACGGCESGSSSNAANNANNQNNVNNGLDAGPDAANNGDGDMNTTIPGLTELSIDPPMATVADDGVDPGETQAFRALGMVDGVETEVTDSVVWTIENEDLGTIDTGLFTSAGIAGTSTITATAGAIRAEAQITVTLAATQVDPDAPAGIDALFPDDTTADVVDAAQLLIVYPSHETMFPKNLERATYQWFSEAGLDAFELRFESPLIDVRFYTDQNQFLPTPIGWRWLAYSHAGSSVTLTVRGVSQSDPTTVYSSQTIDIYFSRDPVLGALFYWSTGAQGIMKAHISSPTATKFYTDPAAEDQECVSCHTVARNGTKMFVNYGGEKAHNITVPNRDVLIPPPGGEERDGGWATFNPDASRLLLATKGELFLLDADTGQEISQVALPADTGANHPDWAPAGDYVVVAYGESGIGNKGLSGTSIARIPVNGDDFGMPEVLVPSMDDDKDTLFFPSYAPNSEWIAFVRTDGGSKDSEQAEVFLVPADGGEPIPLPKLNQRVRHEDGIIEIGNTMPTWAPQTDPTQPYFLSFSSLRWYGHIREDDNDQLWGAAIDFSAIGQSDPSYAAFWMPFQDLEEGNHRSFWVIDTEEECPSDREICDGIDNTCDGVVDEDCCTPEPEICDDGIDNDCDGAADEGCGCTWPEICDDGIDNDCDRQIDLDDIDCVDCVPAGGTCTEDNDCCSRICGNGMCIVQ